MKKILITAALPYINNSPHLGHIAGSHLPADIFARYSRQKGYDVHFVGGSDEFGSPSLIAANKANESIDSFTNKYHEIHKRVYKNFNISYDTYSRTSSKEHISNVQDFYKSIPKEFLSIKEDELYFSEADNMFLSDRFISGICPKCNKDANSDQCEHCGKLLSSKELIDPKSNISNSSLTLKKTDHIYLNLSMASEKLDEWLESKKDIFKHHVYSEAKKWIKEGLKDRSITRDMSWGVPVPNMHKKVFYVWFDAPIGYMSFSKNIGVDWKDCDVYHFLGKDNIPFHTIFWPAMLMFSKNKLPYNVVGYNYLNYEGNKFSKSKNIGIFCEEIIDQNIDIDSLRFYLTSILPESKDSDFKWKEFTETVNSQLIGNLSNFLNRTVSMINRYFNGNIDVSDISINSELLSEKVEYFNKIDHFFANCEFRSALRTILEFSSLGNKYIDKTEPWNVAKNDMDRLRVILYSCLDHAMATAIFMNSIIPNKISSFWKEQLMLDKEPSDSSYWNSDISFPKKHRIGEAKPLFKRLDN